MEEYDSDNYAYDDSAEIWFQTPENYLDLWDNPNTVK